MNNPSKTAKQRAPQDSQPIDRRSFVRLTTLATVSALATGAEALSAGAAMAGQTDAASVVSATLSIQQTRIVDTVILDSRFASLSFEKDSINRSPVYLSGDNADLIGLLNALGGGVLRIGANSVDETTWTPDGSGQTSGQVAPIDVQNFAGFDTEVSALECHLWRQLSG
jgi:hypothetical protein